MNATSAYLNRQARTEAEAREARRVRCFAGEKFEDSERRLLKESYDRAMQAKRAYLAEVENSLDAKDMQVTLDYFSDMEGDTWRPAIERAEG